jgi:hypothetical protein
MRGIREITAEIWAIRREANSRIEALEDEIKAIRVSRGQHPEPVYVYVSRPTEELTLVRKGYRK